MLSQRTQDHGREQAADSLLIHCRRTTKPFQSEGEKMEFEKDQLKANEPESVQEGRDVWDFEPVEDAQRRCVGCGGKADENGQFGCGH
jgi:hypothetical protein